MSGQEYAKSQTSSLTEYPWRLLLLFRVHRGLVLISPFDAQTHERTGIFLYTLDHPFRAIEVLYSVAISSCLRVTRRMRFLHVQYR